MRQRGVLQVGVDLLDDGMGAVDLVDGHGVSGLGISGGEERVMPPQLEQPVLPGALLRLGVGVRDAAHHQPAGHPLALLLRGERDVGHLGDLRRGDPGAAVFVEDRPWVLDRGPRTVVDAGVSVSVFFTRCAVTTTSPIEYSSITADETETEDMWAFHKDDHAATNPNLLLTGTYNVFAMPIESPYYGNRTLVLADDVVNLTASPYGWHDTNGSPGNEYTTTRGNNVNAYEDGNNPGFQPNPGGSMVFDYPFDQNYSNATPYEAAAITNLFYWRWRKSNRLAAF